MSTGVLDDITCRELTELVSDYVEGALDEADGSRFEAHLVTCGKCTTYVDQLRRTIAITGRLREDDLEPVARDALLEAFRNWKRGR